MFTLQYNFIHNKLSIDYQFNNYELRYNLSIYTCLPKWSDQGDNIHAFLSSSIKHLHHLGYKLISDKLLYQLLH